MLRVVSLFAMSSGFLLISPPLRGSALAGLGRVMFEMDKYSPWSFIVLAIAVGLGAVWSMANPKPQ